MMDKRRAVMLLSGGVDSAIVLALAVRDGFEIHAFSFSYGQVHLIELDAARRLAEHYEVAQHIVVEIDPTVFGGAVLSGGDRSFWPSPFLPWQLSQITDRTFPLVASPPASASEGATARAARTGKRARRIGGLQSWPAAANQSGQTA
jgi:hypothetical protein